MIETTRTLRGLSFGVIEWPDPSPTPVCSTTVLLHGWMENSGYLAPLAARLTGHRLALDLRGHGQSAHCAPGHMPQFADYLADVDALLDQLDGPVRLIGHSMGGTVASMIAGLRPERVERLILLDGLGIADGVHDAYNRLLAHLDSAKITPRQSRIPSLADAAARLARNLATLDADAVELIARRSTFPAAGGLIWSVDPRIKARLAVPYNQAVHLQVLERVRCPALLLVPEHVVFDAEDFRRLTAALPVTTIQTIPGTTHRLHIEAPALVADAIEGFLQGT